MNNTSRVEEMLKRHLKEVKTDRFVIDLNLPADYPEIKARRTEEGGVRDRFMAAYAELPDEITIVRPFCTDGFCDSNKNTFHVSPDGSDDAEGTKDAPLATIQAALARAKGLGGAKIFLAGGIYTLDETVKITSEHSGKENSPLIITAEAGEEPVISASIKIPAASFGKLTDEKMLSKLKPEVREKVLVCDLKALGITEYGTVGEEGTVLMVDSVQQDLARYPNVDEELIVISENIYNPGYSYETKSETGPWEIGISDERCLEWEWDDEFYIHGALAWEWDRLFTKIGRFDREKKSIVGGSFFAAQEIKYDPYNTYYFTNVFEELDRECEWYLDRKTGKLYFYPANPLTEDTDIRIIIEHKDAIVCEGAENVIIDRLNVGRCSGSAIRLVNCRQALIQRCHITGTTPGKYEGSAVEIMGGYRSGIIDSTIEHFSGRAACCNGGDRKTLTPANNFVQNCKVVNPLNRFGIYSGGCGNVISHNYLHNTTINDTGHNEGIFEYNIIEGGDTETHDTGMIYVAGGGLSSCGNHYRYNYFFDFAKGDYGLYFDDLSRGMYAYGNIVVGNGTIDGGKTWGSGGRSFNHHNGGEHVYYNNISIDAGYFAFGGDISYWNHGSFHWKGFFEGIYGAYKGIANEKYFGRNPTYRDFCEAVEQFHEDKKDPDYVEYSGWAERRLRLPWCNHYENNLIFRAARPFKLDNGLETATGLETNYITNDDPGFVDLEGRNYAFKPDAKVFEAIPGFKAPNFSRMGPLDDFAE